MSAAFWNGIIAQHVTAQASISRAITPRSYRGWSVERCEWTGELVGTGPNFDASWEGEEDGWVSNGEQIRARDFAELSEEIDDFLAAKGGA